VVRFAAGVDRTVAPRLRYDAPWGEKFRGGAQGFLAAGLFFAAVAGSFFAGALTPGFFFVVVATVAGFFALPLRPGASSAGATSAALRVFTSVFVATAR
jgi:hypothetical protein